jgi:hypothetical protein
MPATTGPKTLLCTSVLLIRLSSLYFYSKLSVVLAALFFGVVGVFEFHYIYYWYLSFIQ